jgi:multidrug resistance efflux pump
MSKKFLLIGLVLIVLLSTGIYVIWQRQQEQKNNEKIIEASGTIEAREVTVSSELGGKLIKVNKEEGDHVKKGQLLAEIESEMVQVQVKQAEAGVEIAKLNLDTAEDRGIDNQIDIAKAQLKQARAALEQARANLKKTKIKAPVSGTIIEKYFEQGELVVPGSSLFAISNLEKVTLTVYIEEVNLGKVKLGQKAEVKVDAYPDRIFEGEVTQIANQAEFTPSAVQTKEERATTVYAVKISLDNKDLTLKAGMPADAIIHLE